MKVLNCFILFLFLLLLGCSEQAGGGTEGGNVDIAGTVQSESGSVANARVFLFPVGYNPNDSTLKAVDTVTGSDGSFTITDVDTGRYVIRIESENKQEGYLSSLPVSASDTSVKAFSLAPVGGVTLLLDTSIDTSGRSCFVENTNILLPLSEATKDQSEGFWKLEFDALPPGVVSSFLLWNDNDATQEDVVAEDITVESGKSQTVGDDLLWLPFDKTGMPLDEASVVNNMVYAKEKLWFATDAGLYTYNSEGWKSLASEVGVQTYFDVETMSNGSVILGTADGEYLEVHGDWKSDSSIFTMLGSNPITNIHKDLNGGLWFAQKNNGLVYYKSFNTVKYTNAEMGERVVTYFAESENGRMLFLTTSDDILEKDDDEFVVVAKPASNIKRLVGGAGEQFWGIMGETLYHFDGSSWTSPLAGEFDDVVYDPSSGYVFLLSDNNSLYKYDGESWKSEAIEGALSEHDYRIVVHEGKGYVYSNNDLITFSYMY